MYSFGEGVAKDQAEAARLFRLAADQGYVFAQNALGAMYFEGKGVAKDVAQAAVPACGRPGECNWAVSPR